MRQLVSSCILPATLFVASCQKPDQPVALPEKGEVEYSVIEMGEDYKDQVFFSFATNSVVHESEINSWHLAFESSSDGFHIFMNGGADVFLYNTHETDFSKVTTAPAQTSNKWDFDRPCGIPDSTAIGDWRGKNEVWIVKLNPTTDPNNMMKFRMISVTQGEYVMEYGHLDATQPHTIVIPKDYNYNYSYFSFYEDGRLVYPDPPKAAWDIVFTRYRIIYYDLDNFPYIVNGVLTNPYKTTTARDTTSKFTEIEGAKLLDYNYSDHRNIIGYSWKTYNYDKERYTINQSYNYIIKTQKDEYWKMHFLDFYNKQGVKGSPSFEFQRAY